MKTLKETTAKGKRIAILDRTIYNNAIQEII